MFRTTTLALALLLAAGSVQAQGLQGRLKKIADGKSITIAYRADATPFSFTDDKQQVVGSSIDLCKRVVNMIERQIKVPYLQVQWLPVTVQTRFDAVAKGQADAFASDRLLLVGAGIKARDPKSFYVLPDELSFEPYGIVLPRGDPDFRLAVNTGLSHLYGSGEIVEIFGRWFRQFGDPGPVIRAMYLLGTIPE